MSIKKIIKMGEMTGDRGGGGERMIFPPTSIIPAVRV